ncbi:MAG: alcohol dehydrogenase catalytic domain-containing protein [Candidatus Aenigmatarchaeota archaeon]
MRVAMYYNNHDIRLQEMPMPDIGENEILLKTMASGICGSDVMEWYRIKSAPRVLGHEVAGIVEKVGKKVKKFKKGDRIFVTHHVPCEKCKYCKEGNENVCDTLKSTNFYPGGFAEYIRIPEINVKKGVLKIPKNISFEEATFIEPLGCVIRGQNKIGIKKGHIVLVLGSGMAGLLHIQLAKLKGAKVIATDINDFRMKIAKRLGADLVLNATDNIPDKLKNFAGKLADRVIVSTGAQQAILQAFECIDKGGKILFFAPTEPNLKIPLPFNDLWFKGVSIETTYAAMPKELKEALSLISNKKIKVKQMITHRLPLSETQKGFELVMSGKDSIKVIIEPQK